MLEVADLRAWYGHTQALFGMSFSVAAGETVALTGLNGAGKTTTVNAIAGLLRSEGDVRLDGEDIARERSLQRGRRGLALVPETRRLFWAMTVRENLIVAAGPSRQVDWAAVLDLFPALEPRLNARADRLSGGQQQMVALARAFVRDPRLLLLDEPGLGLAPAIIKDVYGALERIKGQDRAIVVVEQSFDRAARFADRLILVRGGRVAAEVSTDRKDELESLRARAFEPARG